jgi:hypothetical protein
MAMGELGGFQTKADGSNGFEQGSSLESANHKASHHLLTEVDSGSRRRRITPAVTDDEGDAFDESRQPLRPVLPFDRFDPKAWENPLLEDPDSFE